MAGYVRDRDMGWDELQRSLRRLAGEQVSVLVGVQGKTDSEMVVIAASNEYGTADGHIPERSYLRSTVDQGETEILDDLTKAVERTLDGGDLDRELGRTGEKWVGRVKETIRDLDDPPNAPATIQQKQGADNPLIDQGRLRNSITWTLHRGPTQKGPA